MPPCLSAFPFTAQALILDPVYPAYSPMCMNVELQEVHAFFYDDENSLSDGTAVTVTSSESSSSVHT